MRTLVDTVVEAAEQMIATDNVDLPIKSCMSSEMENLNMEEHNAAVSLDEQDTDRKVDAEIAKNSLILVEIGISLEEQKSRFIGMAPSVILNRQKAEIRWW